MKTLLTALFLMCLSFAGAQSSFIEVEGLPVSPASESVAVGDFNGDGLEDLYIGFPLQKNQLWKNIGDGTFAEMAEAAGVALLPSSNTKTAVWGDIDNDGDLDLYVGNKQTPDKLFRNNGNETFSEISLAAGIYQLGHPQSANMADVNNDGWLDIYVSNFFQQNALYLSNGNPNGGDVTFLNTIYLSQATDMGKAMGTIFFDYDKDGDVDLYLVHDGYEPNFLYENDGTGHFTDVGPATGANTESFGMGVDVGDFNNDGWMDIYIANLSKNFLLVNNGHAAGDSISFTDISDSAGVGDFGMGWGTTVFDFDNDGWNDIYLTNEFNFSPYPNVLYQNLGNLTFEKAETGYPICNELASYGTATIDFNLDGNMDLAVANRGNNDNFQIFQNTERPGAWLGVKLIGVESNRQAVGAKISLIDDQGILHYDELTAGSGWTSQNSQYFHFGLGNASSIQEMTVFWPSGLEQIVDPMELSRYYTIVEGKSPIIGITNDTATVITITDFPSNKELEVSVFPNPTDGRFFINIKASQLSAPHIKISNQLGQVVFEQKMEGFHAGEQVLTIEPADLPPSPLFFVTVTDNGRTSVQKVIVR